MLKIFGLCFLLVSSVGLSMTLEDPHNYADHLKMFFPNTTPTPFICGSPVKFLQTAAHCDILCSSSLCRQICSQPFDHVFQAQAEDCDHEDISIYSSLSWSARVRQTENAKYGQTWIEEFLAAADFFVMPSGLMTITFIVPPRPRTIVDEYGEETTTSAVSVFLEYRQTPEGVSIPFELILDVNQRGLNQILFFGFHESDDYFFKRWGLLQ